MTADCLTPEHPPSSLSRSLNDMSPDDRLPLNDPTLPSDHWINQMPPEAFRKNDGRFQPKLNHAERCAILALLTSGLPRALVSAAFGINRRTAAAIYNEHSLHYKSVRDEQRALGVSAFKERYMTEEVQRRVHAAYGSQLAEAKNKDASAVAAMSRGPRFESSNRKGTHSVKTPNVSNHHRIEIQWGFVDGSAWSPPFVGECWQWRDLDKTMGNPLAWNSYNEVTNAPFKTSAEAYDDALQQIWD